MGWEVEAFDVETQELVGTGSGFIGHHPEQPVSQRMRSMVSPERFELVEGNGSRPALGLHSDSVLATHELAGGRSGNQFDVLTPGEERPDRRPVPVERRWRKGPVPVLQESVELLPD